MIAKYLRKGRLRTITTKELRNGRNKRDDYSERAVQEEAFSDAFVRRREKAHKEGRATGVYDLILKNYRRRRDVELPEKLEKQISGTGFYPALKEIEIAVWSAPAVQAFEKQVEAVVKQYAGKIEALKKKNA